MGRHDKTSTLLPQPCEIGKSADIFCISFVIEQEYVFPFDRLLDPGNQHDAALGRIGPEAADVQLPLVQRDSERVVPESRSPVNQVGRRIRN